MCTIADLSLLFSMLIKLWRLLSLLMWIPTFLSLWMSSSHRLITLLLFSVGPCVSPCLDQFSDHQLTGLSDCLSKYLSYTSSYVHPDHPRHLWCFNIEYDTYACLMTLYLCTGWRPMSLLYLTFHACPMSDLQVWMHLNPLQYHWLYPSNDFSSALLLFFVFLFNMSRQLGFHMRLSGTLWTHSTPWHVHHALNMSYHIIHYCTFSTPSLLNTDDDPFRFPHSFSSESQTNLSCYVHDWFREHYQQHHPWVYLGWYGQVGR